MLKNENKYITHSFSRSKSKQHQSVEKINGEI